jgi:hypothetical protein
MPGVLGRLVRGRRPIAPRGRKLAAQFSRVTEFTDQMGIVSYEIDKANGR